ncbi:MAG TPA: hypothetical protein VGD78_03970 [Chthoniobacterales bacterium]
MPPRHQARLSLHATSPDLSGPTTLARRPRLDSALNTLLSDPMIKVTCPHCGHVFSAAELKALTKSVLQMTLQGITASGEKAGSVAAAAAKQARDAVDARVKKYREDQARNKKTKGP